VAQPNVFTLVFFIMVSDMEAAYVLYIDIYIYIYIYVSSLTSHTSCPGLDVGSHYSVVE
jgi:hypothetical protein